MGVFRRLAMALMPDPAAVEAESRKWWITCKTCGESRNLWEVGGVRYKARGNKLHHGHCPTCGRRRWLRIHRREAD